ncbi:MAG TPA: YggS family pyridoxal phosphate-dependent enzyme [Gemmatimonadales bacterium]|jgi:hypothetical protein
MSEPALAARLATIRATVAERQHRGGWSHPVEVVAVTKGHGPEAVHAAAEAGLGIVGENRVQEALPKQEACAGVAIGWHLIGTLQRNKVRQVIGRFAMIESIDRIELAQEFDRRVGIGPRQPILVQVNCSNEPQKGGVDPDHLDELLDAIAVLPRVELRGLMTMAALTDDEREQRRAFAMLRQLRDARRSTFPALTQLSMGMSSDFPAAVEEGATMLRLGSILFGPRD